MHHSKTRQPVNALAAIDGLLDLARHRLTTKRREFDRMVAAGKEPNWQVSIKAERAEYLAEQGTLARAAIAELIAADKEYDEARRAWDDGCFTRWAGIDKSARTKIADAFESAIARRSSALAAVEGK